MEEELNDTGDDKIKCIDVPHIKQIYTWDCGLACASMILKYLNIPFTSNDIYNIQVKDLLRCGENVWTIDLAYLMKHYGVSHQLYTITLGANQQFAQSSYYLSNFTKDEDRINNMFEKAGENGVKVEKRSISIEDIIDHIKNNNLAICLIDWLKLDCLWCSKKLCFCCFDICSSPYVGHFVVICGYDLLKKHIYYKNPNTSTELCCCSFSHFDKARQAFGTDEDILLIYNKKDEVT
ncbi:hypothetical protein LOTGIDRAFT_203742 [Lottia gigantea]|uniref:Protein GUCD1 n=1 Tax=Lottia gigantea TaxID=225164 RepID=V4AJN3_LOTGI|nr:hypothetical protein LOTGIDRAFT_203742 [Lottia gigantea]ESO97322.1 hypothetical protein LOTGIDRAFT_203742 [Lottia gigantea]